MFCLTAVSGCRCCCWCWCCMLHVPLAGCFASLLGENRVDAMGKSFLIANRLICHLFCDLIAFAPPAVATPFRRLPPPGFRNPKDFPFKWRRLCYACNALHWSNGHWQAQLINYEINNRAVIRARTRFIVSMHKIRARTFHLHLHLHFQLPVTRILGCPDTRMTDTLEHSTTRLSTNCTIIAITIAVHRRIVAYANRCGISIELGNFHSDGAAFEW